MRFERDINCFAQSEYCACDMHFREITRVRDYGQSSETINRSNSVLARAKSVIASDTRRPK